jgi:hypothetical protein
VLDDELIEAYRRTDYVLVRAAGDIVLNIGRPSAAFDRELDSRRAGGAVVVTAYNPRSEILPDAENRARHAALTAMLDAGGYDYAPGEGRDPTGRWQPEPGFFVFDIPLDAALELARRFEQNAIVEVARGGAPALVYPDDA